MISSIEIENFNSNSNQNAKCSQQQISIKDSAVSQSTAHTIRNSGSQKFDEQLSNKKTTSIVLEEELDLSQNLMERSQSSIGSFNNKSVELNLQFPRSNSSSVSSLASSMELRNLQKSLASDRKRQAEKQIQQQRKKSEILIRKSPEIIQQFPSCQAISLQDKFDQIEINLNQQQINNTEQKQDDVDKIEKLQNKFYIQSLKSKYNQIKKNKSSIAINKDKLESYRLRLKVLKQIIESEVNGSLSQSTLLQKRRKNIPQLQ